MNTRSNAASEMVRTSLQGFHRISLTVWDAIPKPRSRRGRVISIAVLVVLAYALPLINPPLLSTTDSDMAGVLYDCIGYGIVAVGLNIVIGYAGLLDLGYVGFYAVGAYTVGTLTSEHWKWPFFLALPVAVAVTMVSGVLLGAPTLRVRGDYLAIVTLGFGEIVRIVITYTNWLGAASGIKAIPAPPSVGPNPPGPAGGLFDIPHLTWASGYPEVDPLKKTQFLIFGVIDIVPFYWLLLTVLFLIVLGDRLIKASRVGRAWEATREDEDAAEVMGVPTFKYKLLAFAMGAFIGGLSGAFFATRQGFISPLSFTTLLSEMFVAAVIIGGAGNRWGAIIGGVLVAYLPERFRSFADWRMLVFGVALILLTTFRPQGIFPAKATRRAVRAEQRIHELEGEPADAI